MNEILIYQNELNQSQVEVQFEAETFWLSLNQMASLFGRDKSVISRHLKKIFAEGELDFMATVAKNATVQTEGGRTIYREIEYYNLDAILSVGYRVNSRQGTLFRQWATARLKEFLVNGYAINEKRLAEKNLELQHLKNGIAILRRSIEQKSAGLIIEAGNLARLLEQFSDGLSLIDDYDHQTLDLSGKTAQPAELISVEEYLHVIDSMRTEFSSELFGKPKDHSFESSVRQIYQSFDGHELYPSLEEKAAVLLYLIVKNHSFTDGNKRIAAACFLYFMDRNNFLYTDSGTKRIDSDSLASLTLFIAVSKPEEMHTVKQVVISVLNRKK